MLLPLHFLLVLVTIVESADATLYRPINQPLMLFLDAVKFQQALSATSGCSLVGTRRRWILAAPGILPRLSSKVETRPRPYFQPI